MKIEILDSARQDLMDGYRFYQKQAEGIGVYFLDTLFSDIDSLVINAGIHSVHFGKYHRRYPSAFLSPFITALSRHTGLRRSRLPKKPGLDPKETPFESEVRSQE